MKEQDGPNFTKKMKWKVLSVALYYLFVREEERFENKVCKA